MVGGQNMKNRFHYNYEIDDQGYIRILHMPYKTRYVELPREDRFRKLYSYVLIDIDFEHTIGYLEACKQSSSPIIKEGLFKMAVVQYAKCYSPAKHGGRSQITENKVYKGIEGDPIGCHRKFMERRMKYFAHDESDYLQAQVGALLNMDAKKYVGCLYPRKQAKFDYDETIDILMTLCNAAQNWVKNEIDAALEEVSNYIKELDFKVLTSYQDMRV